MSIAWQTVTEYEDILYEVADPIATITLNRPSALNAWTNRMGAEVKHAVAAAELDKRVLAKENGWIFLDLLNALGQPGVSKRKRLMP